MKVIHVPCGPAVNESERKAFARIEASLRSEPGDGRWILLTNLAFSASHDGQPDEIDLVAIGPSGIRVVEVKHWAAAWVRRNSGLVEDEADRVIAKARKIGATMRKKIGSLPHVNGVFLTTETPGKVAGLEGRAPVRGVVEDDMVAKRASSRAMAARLLWKAEGRAQTPSENLIREDRKGGRRVG